MKLELKPGITFEGMTEILTKEFPQYKIKLLKNPVARFQYIQVAKSAFVGIWIRIFEGKNTIQLINVMPSTLARIPFLGLIFTLILQGFFNPSQTVVNKQVADVLINEYDTKEI
ncbi:MAG: hypothetical protein PVF17_04840 [Ignavibacteria bacterium]|jgi:hypothetical protein